MTYLLDTDVLVDFFKHQAYAKALLLQGSQTATLAVSTLTITELRSGWTPKEAAYLLPRLYAICDVLPVTKAIAEQAGIWRQEYQGKGLSLGTVDTVIAATAHLTHASLVTNHTKDYPMPDVSLRNPVTEKLV
jgi:predicted nucleic acid-binding protein